MRIPAWISFLLLAWGALSAIVIAFLAVALATGRDTKERDAEVAGAQVTATSTADATSIAKVQTVVAETTEQAYVNALQTLAAPTATPKPTRTPRPTPKPHYDLRLVSFSCTVEYGFIIVEGFVENVGGARLEDVEAVGIFSDANGTPISSSSALIDYRPLLPGQSSPYKVMDSYNPAMQGCSVQFKEFWGPAYRTDYSGTPLGQ